MASARRWLFVWIIVSTVVGAAPACSDPRRGRASRARTPVCEEHCPASEQCIDGTCQRACRPPCRGGQVCSAGGVCVVAAMEPHQEWQGSASRREVEAAIDAVEGGR